MLVKLTNSQIIAYLAILSSIVHVFFSKAAEYAFRALLSIAAGNRQFALSGSNVQNVPIGQTNNGRGLKH